MRWILRDGSRRLLVAAFAREMAGASTWVVVELSGPNRKLGFGILKAAFACGITALVRLSRDEAHA
jgi:hypothetical protein